MPIVGKNIVSWNTANSNLKISDTMADVVFTAMALSVDVYSTQFPPIIQQLDTIFRIPKKQLAKLIKNSRRLSTILKTSKYPPAKYVSSGMQTLYQDMLFQKKQNILELKNGKQTLILYYELVIIPWQGLIIDKSPRQFLKMFPRLPISQPFNSAIKEIETILQPLGYSNNNLGFGRKFRIFNHKTKKILFPGTNDALLNDTL